MLVLGLRLVLRILRRRVEMMLRLVLGGGSVLLGLRKSRVVKLLLVMLLLWLLLLRLLWLLLLQLLVSR